MRTLCEGVGKPGVELEDRNPGCPACGREFSAQGRKAQARIGNPWQAVPRHFVEADYSGMPDRRGAPRWVRPYGVVDR